MKRNKKGFSLLELLVVILIIGILAAIALPQYQLSVDRTKFATYQLWAETIANAYRHYIIIHNTPPTDIEDIDIDLPIGYKKTSPTNQSCAVFDDMFCCVNAPATWGQNGSVICGKKNDTFAFQQILFSISIDKYYFRRRCYAKNDTARAKRLCESMQYKKKQSDNLPTQYGHQTGYTSYDL